MTSAAPPAASIERAAWSASHSIRPPPIVPCRPRAVTSMQAPASRGVEPLASISVTSAAGSLRARRSRSRAARRSIYSAASAAC